MFSASPTRSLSSTPAVASSSIFSARARAQSRKLNEFFELDAPLQGLAAQIGDLAEPLTEACVSQEKIEKMNHKDKPLYVPHVPAMCPMAKLARDNETVREVLVYDEEKQKNVKPRLSWYHPDDTMVPRGWFSEGIMADLKYYYSDVGASASASKTH